MPVPKFIDDPAFRDLRDNDIAHFEEHTAGRKQVDFSSADLRGVDLRNVNVNKLIFATPISATPTCAASTCAASTWKAARCTAQKSAARIFLPTSRRKKSPTACSSVPGCGPTCNALGA